MRAMRYRSDRSDRAERRSSGARGRRLTALVLALACMLSIAMLHGVAYAGQAVGEQGTGNREQGTGSTSAGGAGERVALDRVVAVVNGDLILESRSEERRVGKE